MFFFLFAQARYYLPEIGRFISEDSYKGTLPDIQSQNRYIYCTNNPLKYIDPSGHISMKTDFEAMEEIDKMHEGSEVHKIVQAYFMSQHGKEGGKPEVYVSQSCMSKCGSGRADIAWFMDDKTEVYEIKPGSYANPKSKYNELGKKQLAGYIKGMKLDNKKFPEAGTSWNPNKTVLKYGKDKEIVLYTYYDKDPGMIYYNVRKAKQKQEETAKQTQSFPLLKKCYKAYQVLENVYDVGNLIRARTDTTTSWADSWNMTLPTQEEQMIGTTEFGVTQSLFQQSMMMQMMLLY
jgi:hypothetical protein